jgi:hypothetical protein
MVDQNLSQIQDMPVMTSGVRRSGTAVFLVPMMEGLRDFQMLEVPPMSLRQIRIKSKPTVAVVMV